MTRGENMFYIAYLIIRTTLRSNTYLKVDTVYKMIEHQIEKQSELKNSPYSLIWSDFNPMPNADTAQTRSGNKTKNKYTNFDPLIMIFLVKSSCKHKPNT